MTTIDEQNITHMRGDTLFLKLDVLNNGEPYILDQKDTLTFTVKRNIHDEKPVLQKRFSGVQNILLNSADTADMEPGRYIYDVEVYTASGVVQTIGPGKFILKPDVTGGHYSGVGNNIGNTISMEANLNLAALKGDKGDRGEKGETGPAGPKGATGEKGERGPVGPAGPKGETGEKGEIGPAGPAGPKGERGEKGEQGPAGREGKIGVDGKSAYEIAVEHGFSGTETEWLQSLIGPQGPAGKASLRGDSAYEIACKHGFNGTETEWLESLRGERGLQGEKGLKGDTGIQGLTGVQGPKGESGKSAYEIARDHGFSGSEEAWLESLKGEKGATGAAADPSVISNIQSRLSALEGLESASF